MNCSSLGNSYRWKNYTKALRQGADDRFDVGLTCLREITELPFKNEKGNKKLKGKKVIELIKNMGEKGIVLARETRVCEEAIVGRQGCLVFAVESGNCAMRCHCRQWWKEVANGRSVSGNPETVSIYCNFF